MTVVVAFVIFTIVVYIVVVASYIIVVFLILAITPSNIGFRKSLDEESYILTLSKNKDIFKIMRLIGGVQGYFFKIFNPYDSIRAMRNSQHL